MMRSPDDVIQNIKQALHNTHTTSQSVTNNLQHRERLNTPIGHLEDFFQTPTKSLSLLFFFVPQELLLGTNKNETKKKRKKKSFLAHSSKPWISSFSVASPHFVFLMTGHLIAIAAAVFVRIRLNLRSFNPGL